MPDYRSIARQKAKKYGLDPYIFERQINAESSFRPNLGANSAGAVGIAQIIGSTAKAWGVNASDPVASLDAAAKHMAQYVKKYGSYEKALRAYNAGEGAIEKSRGYSETNNYVAKILSGGRDPGKLGKPSSGGKASGGLSKALSGGSPGRAAIPGSTTKVTATSGGQAIALPDVGDATGLSQLLLQGVGKQQTVPQGSVLQAPSFSAEKYGGGPVQPIGLGAGPSSSGIADQLAALASIRGTELPSVQNEASTASATAKVPGLPAVPATKGTATASSSGGSSGGKAGGKAGKVTVAAGANARGVTLQKPILGFLKQLAGTSGREVTVTTATNHNRMTTSGNVSDHWVGNAADLGMGGDARQSQAVDRKGTLVAAHAIQLAGNIPFAKAYAMAHKGGVFNFETKAGRVQVLWRTDIGGNHWNHVHVGLNPNR